MTQVLISASADADIAAILDDLDVPAGRLVVIKYRAAFRDLYRRLGVHPRSGPLRRVLGPEIRIGIVHPYVVIYGYAEMLDTVTILRVVHGRRKMSVRLLREDSPPPSS